MNTAEFRSMALSFPEAQELPHFDLASFRVRKKIFSTLSEKEQRVMVKLSLIEQSVFFASDPNVFYPVPGSWGKGGATYVDLKKVKKRMMKEALTQAYCHVAPKKLGKPFYHIK